MSFLAASIAGTAAPLNPAYKEDEFRFYLEDTIGEGPDPAAGRRGRGASRRRRSRAHSRVRRRCIRHGQPDRHRGRKPVAAPAVDDVALVLHTSGSTGRPKRVPLKHANLSISAQNVARSYALTADDVSMCVMPLFHVHGLVASTLATLSTGGTVVVPAKFSPLVVLARGARSRRHLVFGGADVASTAARACARAPSDARSGKPSRRPSVCGSSVRAAPRCRRRSCTRSRTAFGAPVLEAYGMTEAAHQMASNPLPPAASQAGIGRAPAPTCASASWTRKAAILPQGEQGEVVHPGTERDPRLREQPGGQRHVVRRRLVPDRRPGLPGRRRLPARWSRASRS